MTGDAAPSTRAGLAKVVLVFSATTLSAVTALSLLAGAVGGNKSPLAPLIIIAAMWTPALGRLVTQRTVDRQWRSSLPLRWTKPRLLHVWAPLLIALSIYAAAYAVATALGYTGWEPR